MKELQNPTRICEQAALRTLISVRLAVRLSVRRPVTPFWQCPCHRIILKFSVVITIDRRDVHAKRSRSEVKGQGHRGHSPIYQYSDRNSSLNSHMVMKWWTRNRQLLLELSISDCNSSFNLPMALKCCTKLNVVKKICPIVFQGHPSNFEVMQDKTNHKFWPELSVSGL